MEENNYTRPYGKFSGEVMGAPMTERLQKLSFSSVRRIGVELEVLAFDKESRPKPPNKRPLGIEYIVDLVKNAVDDEVQIREYEHTQGDPCWVVKPDSSCGIEVVTPPIKGWRGIQKIVHVVDIFRQDPKVEVDKRCSVHVHVEVADFSNDQIASLIMHWVKCEPCFMDLVPPERKKNRYCQFIGMSTAFDHDTPFNSGNIIAKVGDVKYHTMNTKQMMLSGLKRKTVEFRIIEGMGCKDPYLIKNWIRLLLHFVERVKTMPVPNAYQPGNAWTGWAWIDPKDVLKLLGFGLDPVEYDLSPGLIQTRNWMIARWMKYMTPPGNRKNIRWMAYQELKDIVERCKRDGVNLEEPSHLIPTNMQEALYSDSLRF